MPGGLWALGFGTGGSNGSPNTLFSFFTDGINGEMDELSTLRSELGAKDSTE